MHEREDSFESRTGVDRRLRERRARTVLVLVELHEHEVPELEEAVGARGGAALGAERRAAVEVQLGVGAARSRGPGLPEVVGLAQALNALERELEQGFVGGDAQDSPAPLADLVVQTRQKEQDILPARVVIQHLVEQAALLARLEGVGDVRVFGARDYSMRVWLDPLRMAAHGLTTLDVERAIRADPAIAALEAANYTPNLKALPNKGSNGPGSGLTGLAPVVNGPTGKMNPYRQGLASALMGEGDPLNIVQEIPFGARALAYSPMWDVHATVWAQVPMPASSSVQLTDFNEVEKKAFAGQISGPDGKPWGPIGVVVNCPIISLEE